MRWLVALGALLFALSASAQETPAPTAAPEQTGTWVPNEDMKTLLQLVQDQKCRTETAPAIDLAPVVVIVDRQNRVYYTGNAPDPYRVHLDWCNYKIDASAKVQIQVAQRVESTWGFRFRPKATFGVLGTELFKAKRVADAFDGGLLLEPFFIQWVNFNAYIGVRSVGAGVGFDLTKNLGAYLGYALTWGDWRSNPFAAISFAIW
jgi:hypothetical protein